MTFTTIVVKLNFTGDEHEKGHVNPSEKDVGHTGTPKLYIHASTRKIAAFFLLN
jgi:hypothetical protein